MVSTTMLHWRSMLHVLVVLTRWITNGMEWFDMIKRSTVEILIWDFTFAVDDLHNHHRTGAVAEHSDEDKQLAAFVVGTDRVVVVESASVEVDVDAYDVIDDDSSAVGDHAGVA